MVCLSLLQFTTFFKKSFYLFIFGWGVSSLLCGLFSNCSMRASHCGGFSRCMAQAVACLSSCGSRASEHRLSSWGSWPWLLHSMWGLPGSGVKTVSCNGRWVLYHWAARGALIYSFNKHSLKMLTRIPKEHSDSQCQASLEFYGVCSSICEARRRDEKQAGSGRLSWRVASSPNWGCHCSALGSSREYGHRTFF